jgi:hypothetical protein
MICLGMTLCSSAHPLVIVEEKRELSSARLQQRRHWLPLPRIDGLYTSKNETSNPANGVELAFHGQL